MNKDIYYQTKISAVMMIKNIENGIKIFIVI